MATTKFYLDLRGKARDGKGSVLISIFHNKSTATIATGIRVSIKEWSGESVIRRDDANILNAKLSKKKSDIDSAIAALSLAESFETMTATDIKHSICGEKEIKDRHLVSVLFDEYSHTGISEGTKEIYRLALGKVLAFGGKKIKIESITVKWLYDFDMFLAKSQGANGRSIYLRALRAICNYAVKTGAASSYPFSGFQIKSEPTRKRCITKDTFRKFIIFPVSDRMAMYRDYFMLMFYLIGINAIDLLTAKPDAIVNGRFEYIRRKTNKRYSIKVEPEAKDIIDKYRGTNYLLDALDHCVHPECFLHMMNDALKSIGPEVEIEEDDAESLFGEKKIVKKVEPIIPDITTYFARHTWATFASELDIPFDTISQALGHSTSNRTTLIYIKYDQGKIDAANRKVIDYLIQP